ncbi:MAG TPA: hypothetical protein VKZ18_15690 [Polyangia bacterium]|nr:hypothetical protein [Polyangia bacterium]
MQLRGYFALVIAALALGWGRGGQSQTLRAPEARQGFYVSAGAGANAIVASDKGQRDGAAVGLAYTLHFGEMLTDRWGLGLAIEGGSAARSGITTGIAGLTLEAQARLLRHLAAHVGAGVGGASAKDPSRVGDESHGTYGSLLTAGLSYDAFVVRRPSGGWAITPALGLRAVPGGDVGALAGVVSLSVSWWSGLPARELRAP